MKGVATTGQRVGDLIPWYRGLRRGETGQPVEPVGRAPTTPTRFLRSHLCGQRDVGEVGQYRSFVVHVTRGRKSSSWDMLSDARTTRPGTVAGSRRRRRHHRSR